MSEINKVLEKIQKLLNLASDKSNEHESAVAASMAAKMMAKYNIDMADVIAADLTSNKDNLVDEALVNSSYAKNPPLWLSTLAINITKVFDCRIRMIWNKELRRYKIHIFGYKPDVQVSRYVFVFIFNRILEISEEYENSMKKQNRFFNITLKKDYMLGLAIGIYSKLSDLYKKEEVITSSGTSLVVLKTTSIVEKYGEFNYIKKEGANSSHFNSGYRDSSKIELLKSIVSPENDLSLIGN